MTNTPPAPVLTYAQVAEFRRKAIAALRDYRNALVLIDAKPAALQRLDDALAHLGAT